MQALNHSLIMAVIDLLKKPALIEYQYYLRRKIKPSEFLKHIYPENIAAPLEYLAKARHRITKHAQALEDAGMMPAPLALVTLPLYTDANDVAFGEATKSLRKSLRSIFPNIKGRAALHSAITELNERQYPEGGEKGHQFPLLAASDTFKSNVQVRRLIAYQDINYAVNDFWALQRPACKVEIALVRETMLADVQTAAEERLGKKFLKTLGGDNYAIKF
ncbi:hypothetical protein FACS189425_01500 [Clostridia bacterium]|nr:hypothetical protein FACS189425_01500 [Clostridia bacterium]